MALRSGLFLFFSLPLPLSVSEYCLSTSKRRSFACVSRLSSVGLITFNFSPWYPRPSLRFSRFRVGKVSGRRVFRFSLSLALISRRISP
jgi:hypothetical protein